ncbi:hypothetical protein ASD8599_02022 [Ascidiaceihabitans donghaensis]|uniref:Uncharacterized protein n=1 Tax=Ascidiaceihabitans donghaensis TaxID=1510460 RepID=A0A2R8BDV8_9RHOB|nr:hypothetical protein [Ascidiaceihabitans donghaensis]SPH21271.1 hypothetical protein ASD8599_02022 [Ascidiaceihabitans donghaensis]
MAVSTTSFSDRLGRIERSTPQLYAGDDAPQSFKPDNLVCNTAKKGAFYYAVILFGLIVGAGVGYAFRTAVGFEIFVTQPPLLILAIVKADPQMLGLTLAVVGGAVITLLCQIFGNTKARALQFWTGYMLGMVLINLQAFYFVYLTYFAATA